MVKIEVKATTLPKDEKEMLNYADMLLLCMKQVAVNGLTVGEMGERLEVIKKFKDSKVGDTVEIEDAQLPGIKACVESMRWSICHEDIKAFGDLIETL